MYFVVLFIGIVMEFSGSGRHKLNLLEAELRALRDRQSTTEKNLVRYEMVVLSVDALRWNGPTANLKKFSWKPLYTIVGPSEQR
jgi:hypothetical protein